MAASIRMIAVARAMKRTRRARTVIMNVGVGARASSKAGKNSRGSETYQCPKRLDRHHHRADGTSIVVTSEGTGLVGDRVCVKRNEISASAREKSDLRGVTNR
jgi:hypothetical protein